MIRCPQLSHVDAGSCENSSVDLQVLETAGLVERVRAGREVLYAARRDPLDASARWLADLSATWDRRLNALKHAAEAATSD